MELYRACDCFVSLHRAEGYGRGIAEALLLGLDVIATGHGGNVDFCRKAGARLVAHKDIPLKPGGVSFATLAGYRPDVVADSQIRPLRLT
jgi:glycosyltransferase involved in cell wall biosynthesis